MKALSSQYCQRSKSKNIGHVVPMKQKQVSCSVKTPPPELDAVYRRADNISSPLPTLTAHS